MRHDVALEAILFYKAVPVSKRQLLELLMIEEAVLEATITALSKRLTGSALALTQSDTTIALTTNATVAPLIEEFRKDELKGDIGPAGAETLAIIAYRGPISKAAIDRIRGVNSATIIRNLMVRGLIERNGGTTAGTYHLTVACYAELGITTRQELPHFSSVMNALEQFDTETNTTAT